MRSAHFFSRAAVISIALLGLACDSKEEPKHGGDVPPPPPTVSSAKAGVCNAPGTVNDPVSASFFPKSVSGYCVDPQSETKTYGDRGKLSMDEVCTTAFDGECEVYKKFGLKRVVSFHYVDGSGKGGSVEVILSQFADEAGAYAMYTMRVVAGDPADPTAPRVLDAKTQGAIGTGRAYVWRGAHLAELQYNNEQESPDALAKSSDGVLRPLGREIGDKLPGAMSLPPAAAALPSDKRIPNGISFVQKEPFGITNLGAGAIGFYKDGDKRWRVLSLATTDADQAKDAMKTLRGRPGALPLSGVGDEGLHLTVSASKDSPKVEMYVARKNAVVLGITDDEYALTAAGAPDKQAAARISKDDALAKLKALLASTVSPPPPIPSTKSSADPLNGRF